MRRSTATSPLISACLTACLAVCLSLCVSAPTLGQGRGWTRLFDGQTLSGWKLVGQQGVGYVARDGVLIAPSDGGGYLFTEKPYSDFQLRLEFKTDKAGNNGIAIRAPRDGSDPAYHGMEIQILDDNDPSYADLMPGQYCGSVYRVAPAKRGAVKPAGEWNKMEITAQGRRIRVKTNGQTVVDADLNQVTDPATLGEHPGMLRDSGYIGFMGHGPSEVQFRNVWIKDTSKSQRDNKPPQGFTALFNGKDLTGWKGLVDDPPARAKMTPEELSAKTAAATIEALKHWKAVDGAITYDGKNNSLCTAKDYGDFEMLVDWKIEPEGDSGIYLRGSPQVQIWDNPVGSGGLYNNQKNPSNPLVKADNPPGQWNTFRILMVGDKVTVFLNNELVVNNTIMENYWEREKPIYPTGQIELQHHGSNLWFKNIYIRELPRNFSIISGGVMKALIYKSIYR